MPDIIGWTYENGQTKMFHPIARISRYEYALWFGSADMAIAKPSPTSIVDQVTNTLAYRVGRHRVATWVALERAYQIPGDSSLRGYYPDRASTRGDQPTGGHDQ